MLLLGASGAGKSTLLHALAGVLGDDSGEHTGLLRIGGAPPRPGRAGLVLQDPDSQVILERVGDDVAFGCENLGVPRDEIWTRVGESLAAVGLDVGVQRATSTLSGGQKQRLALAGALAMRPGILLLDEPTANLDPEGVVEVRDAVARVVAATGATLVVVEHRVAVWRDLVDRVIVLGPEGVVADGPPATVLRARGAQLAAAGIWVPEHPPSAPRRTAHGGGRAMLSASALAVGRDHVAVRSGLDVEVSSARTLAITGRNGSGKSTLALTLSGLLAPVAGALVARPELAGDASATPIRWRSRELLTRVGMVFQDPEHQFLASTVRAELEVGPRALRRLSEVSRTDELLERLRLAHLADANPFTLSGGEKRRLSVATALATAPRVLVLDEPTYGQDSRTWSELLALLAELADAGTAIVAATHDLDFVDALADDRLELS